MLNPRTDTIGGIMISLKRKFAASIAAALTLISVSSMTSCSGGEAYEIGICQLSSNPALVTATEAFKTTLTEKLGKKVTFIEKNAEGKADACEEICEEFVSGKVDLILANSTTALKAAAAATKDIPIIGTSVTDFASALGITDWKGNTGKNIAGTSDITAVSDQASMVAELFPSVNYSRVGILRSASESNSRYLAENLTPMFTALGYTVTDYTFNSAEDIEAVTKDACENSDVVFLPSDNSAVGLADKIHSAAAPSKTPIVTSGEATCRICGVASLSIDYAEIGKKAALQAYEVLVNGADIGDIKIESANIKIKKYNQTIAAELGITIPDGYVAITD